MKSLLTLLTAALLLGQMPSVQRMPGDLQLPDLHKIKSVTLSPPYSCRTPAEFQTGYANTALFLSAYSKQRNSPELLFNGACGAQDYFEGVNAGDYLDVIADIGEVALTDLSAQQIFSPQNRVDSQSTFTQWVPVQAGHTYAALVNTTEVRGFFYFRVVNFVPDQKVDLEYVVMDYQLLRVAAESPGFDWVTKGSY